VTSYLLLGHALAIHWSYTPTVLVLEESLLFPLQERQLDPSIEQVAQLGILLEQGLQMLFATSL
jgi:hypothetical protein